MPRGPQSAMKLRLLFYLKTIGDVDASLFLVNGRLRSLSGKHPIARVADDSLSSIGAKMALTMVLLAG